MVRASHNSASQPTSLQEQLLSKGGPRDSTNTPDHDELLGCRAATHDLRSNCVRYIDASEGHQKSTATTARRCRCWGMLAHVGLNAPGIARRSPCPSTFLFEALFAASGLCCSLAVRTPDIAIGFKPGGSRRRSRSGQLIRDIALSLEVHFVACPAGEGTMWELGVVLVDIELHESTGPSRSHPGRAGTASCISQP